MEITFDAALFDNDGVLVDSHVEVDRAWRQIAEEFGLDIDMLLSELAGVRSIDTLCRYLPPARARLAAAQLEELEVELANLTRPLAGALKLTSQLPANRWSIVTSASRRIAEARWRGAAIAVPPSTVTADDVTHGKPHPEPFLTAARLLGVDPTRCVVFEDSASGGAAGLAAGAIVIAVGSQTWEATPTARVQNLSEVVMAIDGRGRLLLRLEN